MKKDKAIEIATYIIVFLAIWVISPLLGKYIDTFYFNSPYAFADSIGLILAGLLFIVAGSAIVGWTIYLFKIKGQGTPNPKLPPQTLIVMGPYKYSRNPMALGGFLVLFGQAMVYYSPSLLGISMLYGIIIYFNAMYVEEPELKKRFGESYKAYMKQVPRFFPHPSKTYQEKAIREEKL